MASNWPPDEIIVEGRAYIARDAIPAPCESGPSQPEPLYTAAKIAAMASVSRSTVYSLMDDGVIEFTVPNGCERPRLVSRSEYERWVGLRQA